MDKTVEQYEQIITNKLALDFFVRCLYLPKGVTVIDEARKEARWLMDIFLDQTKDDCPECKGEKSVWLGGNSNVFSPCPICQGTGKVGEWHLERLEVKK